MHAFEYRRAASLSEAASTLSQDSEARPLAGGMTLLFATDIRVAAEHAQFGISEVKRGILPGNGGTQRALRQLPYPIAMELLLIGDMYQGKTSKIG